MIQRTLGNTLRVHAPSVPANRSSLTLQQQETPQLKVNSYSRAVAEDVQQRIRSASAALKNALSGIQKETRAVYTTSRLNSSPVAAAFSGKAARLTSFGGAYSTLESTQALDLAASTVRSSSSALGLDLSVAASYLHSSEGVGLDVSSSQSASTLQSTAEMNTATKSLSDYDLTFAASTSHAQISGAYNGSATQLKFQVTLATSVNTTTAGLVSFNVLDQNNNQIATFSGSVTAGQIIDVGNTGLKVRFTAGTLGLQTATTDVSSSPTTVSTSAAFNAGWGTAPVFENYQQVSAGSFTINGTSIAVNANDSIDSVISRINSSNAGVIASVIGDKISLATTSNSEDNIVIGNDTSGFVAATKLSGATTTRGNLRDDQQILSKTTQFGSVSSGSFTINGVAISVNKDTDTLASLISRINESGAGVTAAYDVASDRVKLTATEAGSGRIQVENDNTGFVNAVKLNSGNTVEGWVSDDHKALSAVAGFAGVVTGSFSINGVSIAVDAEADSLQTLISRINDSGAGVTANYDSATDKLTFTPAAAGGAVVLGNDSSGFVNAANILTGTAGSFSVNGVSIEVDHNDTVAAVLAKITASNAAVSAAYNEAAGTVTLTSTETSADPITLSGDTSGFLAKAKLDNTAVSTAGSASSSPFQSALQQMSEYSGVTAGVVTVNGQQVAIDPSSTTIEGFVASLNALDGISATFDSSKGRMTIQSTEPGETVTVSDTSGLLVELGIASRSYFGSSGVNATMQVQTGTMSVVTNSEAVSAGVANVTAKLDEVLSRLAGKDQVEMEKQIRDVILNLNEVRGSVNPDKLSDAFNKNAEKLDKIAEKLTVAPAGPAPESEAPQPRLTPFQLSDMAKAILARRAYSQATAHEPDGMLFSERDTDNQRTGNLEEIWNTSALRKHSIYGQ